jgi:hypothetical protein
LTSPILILDFFIPTTSFHYLIITDIFIMKSFISVSLAFAALAAATPLEQRAAKGCNADNCLRALTVSTSNLKTARPIMALADCSAYAFPTSTYTVTPAVSYVSQIKEFSIELTKAERCT